MGGLQQCVKDVVSIANKTEDFGQAKARIRANQKPGSRQGETSCRPDRFSHRGLLETEEMEKWSFQRTRELMTP